MRSPAATPLAGNGATTRVAPIGAKLSDSRAALPLPACGERSEFAHSSRKFRVRGPLHGSERCRKAFFTLSESALAERPPHPDPLHSPSKTGVNALMASGEREQAWTASKSARFEAVEIRPKVTRHLFIASNSGNRLYSAWLHISLMGFSWLDEFPDPVAGSTN